jgi:hypothetical protein
MWNASDRCPEISLRLDRYCKPSRDSGNHSSALGPHWLAETLRILPCIHPMSGYRASRAAGVYTLHMDAFLAHELRIAFL